MNASKRQPLPHGRGSELVGRRVRVSERLLATLVTCTRGWWSSAATHNFVKRLRDSLQRRNQELELLFQKIERIEKRRNFKAVYEKNQDKVKGYDLPVDRIALLKVDVYTYLVGCENP